MAVYVLDSNFFIQAHRANYPLDVALGFWNKVQQLAKEGKIISIDKVKNEIFKNEDDLKKWCEKNLPKDFFKDTKTVLDSYSQIVSWAVSKNNQYNQNALNEFLNAEEADAWLISYAHTHKLTIITQELSQPESKRKVKIPDVCIHFGIPFINTIEMFRELREHF